jgi:Uma2 family endonuclease
MPPTRLKFGPADHGREVTAEESEEADYVEGYKYEVIDGRFYVVPIADLPEQTLEGWLRRKLERYAEVHPDVVNWVTPKARVFVPDRPELTVPEPDLAAYRDFPFGEEVGEVGWQDISPLIVAEVLVGGDADKDLVRNVELYHAVPSIVEYWVFDGRPNPARPHLLVHRRWGNGWRTRQIPYGETYTTRTLPGFELLIDPKK